MVPHDPGGSNEKSHISIAKQRICVSEMLYS